jgi:hypothetical protein
VVATPVSTTETTAPESGMNSEAVSDPNATGVRSSTVVGDASTVSGASKRSAPRISDEASRKTIGRVIVTERRGAARSRPGTTRSAR